MISDEKQLEPISDTLNPPPPKFGMHWLAILAVLTLSVIVFLLPLPCCKVFGALLCPCVLGFGWWLTKDDPKEFWLIIHDFLLPSEYDPGK